MTIFQEYLTNLNQKYGISNRVNYALALFKENSDIKEAVVNVLSNTGIAGFRFNIDVTQQIKMESDVTDHYIADNSVVQDNIILKPVIITLNGLHGEYFYSVNKFQDTLAKVVPTFKLIEQFLPELTPAAMQTKLAWQKNQSDLKALATNYATYDKSIPFNKIISTTFDNLNGVDLFLLFQNLYKLKSAQTRAFYYLSLLWQTRSCFTIATSWRTYQNMVITSLVPVRDSNADITDFTITFKQIRKTQSLVTNIDKAGRLKDQTSPIADKGVDKGEEVSTI